MSAEADRGVLPGLGALLDNREKSRICQSPSATHTDAHKFSHSGFQEKK